LSEHHLTQENNDQINCLSSLPSIDFFRYKTIVYISATKSTVVDVEAIEEDDG